MFNIFQTRVTVSEDSPLKVAADALAIPANDHLWMGSGLTGTIKKEGGEEIEAEAIRQGPAALGQSIATTAGELGFQKIYHVIVASQDLKTQTDQVGAAVTALLAGANKDKIAKLAVAPLESEENIKAFSEAAKELVLAMLKHLERETSLREIALLVHTTEARDAYRNALHEAMRTHL